MQFSLIEGCNNDTDISASAVIVSGQSTNPCYSIAENTGVTIVPIDDNPLLGFQLRYSKNGCPTSSGKYDTRIRFHCDPNGNNQVLPYTHSGQPSCEYEFIIPTPLACPVSYLSGGWVFVILYIAAVSSYCLIGCVFKRFYRKAEGVEMIPNVSFWRALPSLVKVIAITIDSSKQYCRISVNQNMI